MLLTAPQEASVVTVANRAELAIPKRTSLPSMLPPSSPSAASARISGGLGPVGHGDAREKQKAHGGQDGPTLAFVADHAAENVGERRAEGEDGHHLDEVRQGGRVLERMGRIGVEEPASVGAQHLDRDLRGDRTHRDRLLRTFERRRFHIGRKRLRDPLPDQEQRIGNAKRQQHVEGAAGDIDPEGPTVLTEARAKPRMRATASTMPVAADRKFWCVSPSIWARYESVLSPP